MRYRAVETKRDRLRGLILFLVVAAGKALEHGFLPLEKVSLKLAGEVGLLANEVRFLSGIVFEIEKFFKRLAVFLLADDVFEISFDNGSRAAKVFDVDGGVVKVPKITGGFFTH